MEVTPGSPKKGFKKVKARNKGSIESNSAFRMKRRFLAGIFFFMVWLVMNNMTIKCFFRSNAQKHRFNAPFSRLRVVLKVNYLGASPRGIHKKLNFNFEASLGVSNPLAVPMKRTIVLDENPSSLTVPPCFSKKCSLPVLAGQKPENME
ncbi:hypothetical protein [Maribacter sp. 2307ULW6-5]|uniref:hypothetical protein n=1 Tax=Maribacter sp. 2307ULW6-5 TaxID=3386275 RepID=UPI0039BC7142